MANTIGTVDDAAFFQCPAPPAPSRRWNVRDALVGGGIIGVAALIAGLMSYSPSLGIDAVSTTASITSPNPYGALNRAASFASAAAITPVNSELRGALPARPRLAIADVTPEPPRRPEGLGVTPATRPAPVVVEIPSAQAPLPTPAIVASIETAPLPPVNPFRVRKLAQAPAKPQTPPPTQAQAMAEPLAQPQTKPATALQTLTPPTTSAAAPTPAAVQTATASPKRTAKGKRNVTTLAATTPPSDDRNFFQKLFDPPKQPTGPALAYARPDAGGFGRAPGLFGSASPAPTGAGVAVYDIEAHTVYMPNGARLEAHSGLGNRIDDPSHVHERNRGATPPQVYNLEPRQQLFHGVRALRLNPVDNRGMYGRVGILAHSYMLGPNGDSNGCVSFRNYSEFLNAYQRGEVKRLVVVANGGRTVAGL